MTLQSKRAAERAARGPSLTQQYKRGEPMTAAVNTQMERQHGAWEKPMTSTDLTIRTMEVAEVNEAEATIVQRIPEFKLLAMRDKVKAAQIVFAYGAQPFHFDVITFKSSRGPDNHVLILNRDGVFFCAQKTMGNTFGGVESRPMTPEEHQNWNLGPDQVGAVSEVFKVIGSNRFKMADHIGIAGGKSERNQLVKTDLQTNGPKLALKRAEVGALNKAAPLGIDVGAFADPGDVIEGDFEISEPDAPAQLGSSVFDTELKSPGTETVVVTDMETGDAIEVRIDEEEQIPRTDEDMDRDVPLLKDALAQIDVTQDMVRKWNMNAMDRLRAGETVADIVSMAYRIKTAEDAAAVTPTEQKELEW